MADTVPIPAGAVVQGTPAPASSAPENAPVQIPQGATISDTPPAPTPRSFDDPEASKQGFFLDQDGAYTVVPKEGEEYQDTMKRAIQHFKSLSEQEQQGQLARESSRPVEKVAKTAVGGAAVTAGTLAALTGVAELGSIAAPSLEAAKSYVMSRLAAATPQLFGEEAAKETLKRIAVKAAGKMLSGGAMVGGAAIVHHVWEELFGDSK
jgi:hypothetical protein